MTLQPTVKTSRKVPMNSATYLGTLLSWASLPPAPSVVGAALGNSVFGGLGSFVAAALAASDGTAALVAGGAAAGAAGVSAGTSATAATALFSSAIASRFAAQRDCLFSGWSGREIL